MVRNSIIAIVLCLIFFFIGRYTAKTDAKIIEKVTRDTVRVFMPPQIHSETIVKTIKVPQLIFSPSDTIIKENIIVNNVEVEMPLERREYRDSSLYAIVSGVSIGGVRPTLEYYETYNTTTTIVEQTTPPLLSPYASIMVGRDALGIGGGVFFKDKHGLGLDYININGKSNVLARYSIRF